MCIISITYLGYVQPAGRQRLVEKRRSTYYLYNNILYFGFECVNSTKRGNVITSIAARGGGGSFKREKYIMQKNMWL